MPVKKEQEENIDTDEIKTLEQTELRQGLKWTTREMPPEGGKPLAPPKPQAAESFWEGLLKTFGVISGLLLFLGWVYRANYYAYFGLSIYQMSPLPPESYWLLPIRIFLDSIIKLIERPLALVGGSAEQTSNLWHFALLPFSVLVLFVFYALNAALYRYLNNLADQKRAQKQFGFWTFIDDILDDHIPRTSWTYRGLFEVLVSVLVTMVVLYSFTKQLSSEAARLDAGPRSTLPVISAAPGDLVSSNKLLPPSGAIPERDLLLLRQDGQMLFTFERLTASEAQQGLTPRVHLINTGDERGSLILSHRVRPKP